MRRQMPSLPITPCFRSPARAGIAVSPFADLAAEWSALRTGMSDGKTCASLGAHSAVSFL